ncbi:hypothetical protein [Haliangium sp.]|uniref:hypothetical protein n=1 Tax=Haliangium sp. TaxID=2663208 RepID=UPI003D0B15E1
MTNTTNHWWGDFELPMNSVGRWQIGPTTLIIEHLDNEWRVDTEVEEDPQASELSVDIRPIGDDDAARTWSHRFAVTEPSDRGSLSALLADRPVVATPERSVTILAGGEATVYVGSPVWVQIGIGDPAKALLELPLHQPADTWFGPSPRVGELCYASRTHCRLRLEDLPQRPHRAITSVQVTNRGETPLVLNQLLLPVLNLALFATPEGLLWTQDVKLERDDREMAPIELRKGQPRHAEDAICIAEPRLPLTDNPMVRAFSAIFTR